MRNVILTPYEIGYISAFDFVFNLEEFQSVFDEFETYKIILSILTMSGVKSVEYIDFDFEEKEKFKHLFKKSETKLEWDKQSEFTNNLLSPYKKENKLINEQIDIIGGKITKLLFAINTNSILLNFSKPRENNNVFVPPELRIPFETLNQNTLNVNLELPIVKYEISKSEIFKLIELYESMEYTDFSYEQSNIGEEENMSNKKKIAISSAGKSLVKKSNGLLKLREATIKLIPLSAKVVNFFFGGIPGLLIDENSEAIEKFLNRNKSIQIYSSNNLFENELRMRVRKMKEIEKSATNNM